MRRFVRVWYTLRHEYLCALEKAALNTMASVNFTFQYSRPYIILQDPTHAALLFPANTQ